MSTKSLTLDGILSQLPVDVSVAEAEITKARQAGVDLSKFVYFDTLDGFGAVGSRYPELSGAAQLELVVSYQLSLAISSLSKRDLSALGAKQRALIAAHLDLRDQHTSWLLGSVFRLVRAIVKERSMARLGSDWAGRATSDLLAVGYVSVLEAAAEYDPTKGVSFAGWAGERLRQDILPAMAFEQRSGALAEIDERLSRVLRYKVSDAATRVGRMPSVEDLRADILAHCQAWQRERLSESELRLGESEIALLVHKKMVKSGVMHVINYRLEALLAVEEGELSLNVGERSGDAGWDVPVLEEDSVAGGGVGLVALGGLAFGDPLAVEQLGLLADEGQKYTRDEKRLVKAARKRVAAPHMQYAWLSPRVEQQVRDVTNSRSERLRSLRAKKQLEASP